MGSSLIFNHVGAPPCVAPKFYDSFTEIEGKNAFGCLRKNTPPQEQEKYEPISDFILNSNNFKFENLIIFA